jgi:hypothetical protein
MGSINRLNGPRIVTKLSDKMAFMKKRDEKVGKKRRRVERMAPSKHDPRRTTLEVDNQ